MSSKLSSAQRSLNIAEKQYACTRMLRSAFAHPSSSPYALTCPHVRMHQQQQAWFGSRTLGIDVGHAKAYMYSCRSVMHFTHRAKRARVDCMWITRHLLKRRCRLFSAEMVRRTNARARHKGRGSERARKRDLNPLRLFTGYKYRSRTDTQIARGVVS